MKDTVRIAALGAFAALGASLGILVALEMNDTPSAGPTPDSVEVTTQIPWDGPTESMVDGLAPPPPLVEGSEVTAAELASPASNSTTDDPQGWQADTGWESPDAANGTSTAHYVADDNDTEMAFRPAIEPLASPAPVAAFAAPDAGGNTENGAPPTWSDRSSQEGETTEPPCGAECASRCPDLSQSDRCATSHECGVSSPSTSSSATPEASKDTPLSSPIDHQGAIRHHDISAESAPTCVVRNPRTSEPIASIRLGGEVCDSVAVQVIHVPAIPDVQRVSHEGELDSSASDLPASGSVSHAHSPLSRTPPVIPAPPQAVVVPTSPDSITPVAASETAPTAIHTSSAEEVIVAAGDSVFDEAGALIEAGQFDVAIDLLRAAARSHGHEAMYHELIGEAFLRMGQYEVAQRALSASLSIDKRSARANFLMGLTLRQLQQHNRSEHYLLQANDLDSRYPLNPGLN